MLKHGPVDVVVLAFGEAHFDGSALSELKRQSAAGVIRVLDIIILIKGDDEKCMRVEIGELSSDQAEAIDFIGAETRGLFDGDDAAALCEGMVPGSAVVGLAIEHTWAVDLVNDLQKEGAELAFNFRVPSPIVDEAFKSLG